MSEVESIADRNEAPSPTGDKEIGVRWPANHSELAILRHPDRVTAWAGVISCEVAPIDAADPGAALMEKITERLDELNRGIPMARARLEGSYWTTGGGPVPRFATDQDRTPPSVLGHFDLAQEPPLRLLVDREGRWVTFVIHHAAFDGTLLAESIKVVLCGTPAPPPHPPLPSKSELPLALVRRLLLPADPVAASERPPESETFLSRNLPRIGHGVSYLLPEACVESVAQFSLRRGRPLRRVGITLGLSRTRGTANMSTYRRVDSPLGEPLGPAIKKALSTPVDPWEIRHSTRLLCLAAPLAPRLSDTIVFTDMGRLTMPGVRRLDGYPVARGRSAVTFCAMRVVGGESSLTLRARDINRDDASAILDDAIARLAWHSSI